MTHSLDRYRFVIGALILLHPLTSGVNFIVVTPVLPLIRDSYDISRGSASLVMSLVIAVQAIAVIPAGILIVRTPLKHTFGLAWLLSSVMVFTPLVDGFPMLLLLRCLHGIGVVMMFPAMAPIVMRWFSGREIPVMNTLAFVAFPLGITLGTFLAVPVSRWIGWENMLGVMALPVLAGAILWIILGRIPPPPLEERITPLAFGEMLRALKSRITILISLADAGAYAQYIALTTWLPTYFNEVRDMDLARAGYITGLMPLAGMVAMGASGFLMYRTGLRKPLVVIPGFFVGVAALGTFMVGSLPLIYISVIAVGLASFFYWSPLYTIPMEMEDGPPERVALIWAMAFAVGSVFAHIAPLSVGFMTDALGTYKPGFILWAVLAGSLLVAGLMLPETGPGALQAVSSSRGAKKRQTAPEPEQPPVL